jgi:hypothetical protein
MANTNVIHSQDIGLLKHYFASLEEKNNKALAVAMSLFDQIEEDEDRVEKDFHSAQYYLAMTVKDLLSSAWADIGIKDLLNKIDRQSESV